MKSISLDGVWSLCGSGARPAGPVAAAVPGNIELDLERAGIVPELFYAGNIDALRPYEFNDWEYTKEFDVPADFPAAAYLIFEGLDGVAEVRLNGQCLGKCENALIRHSLRAGDCLRRGQRNQVSVRIVSPVLAVKNIALDHNAVAQRYNFGSLRLRKPAHAFGWDVSPRVVLGGLWRSVRLEERPDDAVVSWYVDTLKETDRHHALLLLSCSFRTKLTEWDHFDVELSGRCGDSEFFHRDKFYFTSGSFTFEFLKPKLWYPTGYGEQNLYEMTLKISCGGRELCSETRRMGIRTVKLVCDETPGNFVFRFEVNQIPIFVRGANWIPGDALHSRDAARHERMLGLFEECHANMLRVWGGGVYEPQSFYDYCDEHGLMVWQDFMMGCASYPQDEAFLSQIRSEAEWVVAELRQHPSIMVWAGDNEVDQFQSTAGDGRDPNCNRITREVLPQVLYRLDPGRPYLPSSPYVSPRKEVNWRVILDIPEQHIWGWRDYFKSPFYADNTAAFISETGFLGSPAVSSLQKFLSPANLWPGRGNPEWIAHATLYEFRIDLLFDNIRQLFLFEPQTLEEFAAASQAVQAEALKFFIENARTQKWQKSGLIWWNMIDCWPQFSDAAVDYYFEKKLAFDYIRRSQQPLQLFLSEWRDWGYDVIVGNDTLQAAAGVFEIIDADTSQVLLQGDFAVGANSNFRAGKLKIPVGEQRLLLLQLSAGDGRSSKNHYLSGKAPFDFAQYRQWQRVISQLG